MAGRDIQKQYNRDEDMKPGRPPRPSHEPGGAESSTRNDKTMTDPATGTPQDGPPAPNQSDAGRSEDLDD